MKGQQHHHEYSSSQLADKLMFHTFSAAVRVFSALVYLAEDLEYDLFSCREEFILSARALQSICSIVRALGTALVRGLWAQEAIFDGARFCEGAHTFAQLFDETEMPAFLCCYGL